MSEYEAIMDGGGPWGIRLQGGKDFGVPLNVARVTPGSKAGNKRIMAGDTILVINGTSTETLTHLEAQNLIKNAGSRLQLKLRTGKGVSLGEVKQVGGGSFAASPSKTLYTTDVTHSAGVDHKFNSKPKAFGASPTGGSTTQIKKFDPAEYARKKKEELDKYKEEQKKPAVAPDSDVLRMLQNTSISDNQQSSGSFSRLQRQLSNEGEWAEQEKSFRMTADGTDLTDDLPPPPPELMDGHEPNYQRASFGNTEGLSNQSGTFKRLQQHVEDGTADQVQTVFGQPRGMRGQPVPAPQPSQIQRNTATTANPLPKAPMPTGPNFKVGRASAPTFKPNPVLSFNQPKPAPQAVNAGEIVNPNSRQYNPYASRTSPGYTSPTERFSPSSRVPPTSPPAGPPPTPPSTVNVIKSKSVPQPVPSGNNEKELHCHACQQQLMGPFVSAIGKTWHPEHFCCSACNVSLQNQAFVEENNQLFCEKCYNQYYAPKCAHCNNAIIGDVSYRHGVICNQCSSMATTSGMNDPIVCSQSINWLIEQIREANVTYESATSKNADSMERYRVAKMSMAAMNKKRTRLEAEIEEYERNFLTTKRLAEYKQKVFAANANLTQNEKKLTTKISQVESSLNASRSSLSTWKSKLDVISENYRSKKKRLNQLLAAQKQHRGVTQAVEGDLWEMSERIKALQVKDDLRQLRMNALVDEINVVANNTKEVESRSLLAEQHLASLRLYQETIDEEYMQIRIQTLDARDSVELAKRKKKDLMRQNHIYF
ncbi:PDZ and LIM domain protein 5-like isoform X2 [Hydractinia symbiolongicarpus]|uniref:PDZ and LIM domain protein 5-like isoform X2 n=1 Tax=Hydractinia symbiolongicarpus TaxID=13093 RepID=UPI00254E6518|nr:PDZ and LIM domain protein 5-like isoform X2 [Hydractinia symbiolongicarpus]